MIYLASPYSDPDRAVRESRFHAACETTAALMRDGHLVYSPIAHSHPIAEHGLPGDWSFWAEHDRWMLGQCAALWILALPGWKESVGVQAEVAIARSLGLPTRTVPWEEAHPEAS